MSDPIGRRGFLGGVLGSIPAALGWRPKEGTAKSFAIDLDAAPLKPLRYPEGFWPTPGSCHYVSHYHTPCGLHRSLLPPGYPAYTSEDLVRDYNRAAEIANPIAKAGYQLVRAEDDPFAAIVVTTAEVGDG